MTELRTEYKVATAEPGCPTCRAFGRVGSLGGKRVRFLQGMAVTNVSAVCLTCGKRFHWNSDDETLARLVHLSVEELNKEI